MSEPNETRSSLRGARQALQRGDFSMAESSYRRVLAASPMHPGANQGLAQVHYARGEYKEAQACLEKVLAVNDGDAVTLNNLGIMLQIQGRFRRAFDCFRKALASRPDFAAAACNLGKVHQIWGHLDEAREQLERALQLLPGYPEALAALAVNHELRGEYAAGLALIQPQLDGGARGAELVVTYGNLQRRLGNSKLAAAIAEDSVTKSDAPTDLMHLHFLLGDLYDDLGAYDRAFSNYQLANRARRAEFDRIGHTAKTDSLIDAFDATTVASLPKGFPASPVPVFIVGMPRSGTSLLEQILAGHESVHPLGEQMALGEIVAGLSAESNATRGYPAGIGALNDGDLRHLARSYFDRSGPFPPGASHFSDKMPANFEHLGLIQMLFPNALIVHCVRNPLDTALSCYFQNFSALGLSFSFDLDNIAVYYRQYRRLMHHWQSVLELEIIDVEYEGLVANTSESAKRICQFIGLPWRPALLEFSRLDRPLPTASHAQVRRKVYDSSVERWRHYEKHIGPLKRALGINDE